VKKPKLIDIDERKQTILRVIVHEYVDTAEPVGSQVIAERYDLGVRSATIRHEMADLSEIGYLRQPHVSAGRIPSDTGYRFYVDRIMPKEGGASRRAEARGLGRFRIADGLTEADIGDVLAHTCKIMAGVTQLTSLATQEDTSEARLVHFHIAPVRRGQALIIAVLSSGTVEHRLIDIGEEVPASHLTRLSNFLSGKLVGVELGSLPRLESEDFPDRLRPLYAIAQQIVEVLKRINDESAQVKLYLEWATEMLRQPELRDPERLDRVLAAFEQPDRLIRILHSTSEDEPVDVIIGGEADWEKLGEMAIVASRYRFGPRARGTIGVIGPTRMDYAKTTGTVGWVARKLNELFDRLTSG
jgi:heat-inducible transcriptional repressor